MERDSTNSYSGLNIYLHSKMIIPTESFVDFLESEHCDQKGQVQH